MYNPWFPHSSNTSLHFSLNFYWCLNCLIRLLPLILHLTIHEVDNYHLYFFYYILKAFILTYYIRHLRSVVEFDIFDIIFLNKKFNYEPSIPPPLHFVGYLRMWLSSGYFGKWWNACLFYYRKLFTKFTIKMDELF